MLRVACWNVNGLRSVLRHDADPLQAFVRAARPDLLALSETKIDDSLVPLFDGLMAELGFAQAHWACCSTKKGYSGTALFAARGEDSKWLRAWEAPLAPQGRDAAADARLNSEGRVLVAELPRCVVVHTYVPNAGVGLAKLGARLDWDMALRGLLRGLAVGEGTTQPKPLVWCGDLNVAHGEWDVHNPTLKRVPGFSLAERESFGLLVGGLADRPSSQARARTDRPRSAVPGPTEAEIGGLPPFFDAWRALHPHPHEVASKNVAAEEPCPYTYWGYRGRARERNKGWRLE